MTTDALYHVFQIRDPQIHSNPVFNYPGFRRRAHKELLSFSASVRTTGIGRKPFSPRIEGYQVSRAQTTDSRMDLAKPRRGTSLHVMVADLFPSCSKESRGEIDEVRC